MHLTPCYIFHFSLRYSIAPANKLLGKDRINPGAARRRISCFLFLRFWCFECPYSERQHSIGGFVFSFLGGDLLLQRASPLCFPRKPVWQRMIQLFPPAANYPGGLLLRLQFLLPLFFLSCLYICILLLICHDCKQKDYMFHSRFLTMIDFPVPFLQLRVPWAGQDYRQRYVLPMH